MGTQEIHIGGQEGMEGRFASRHLAKEQRENSGKFLVEFPDGTTGLYQSRGDAIKALQEWREQ